MPLAEIEVRESVIHEHEFEIPCELAGIPWVTTGAPHFFHHNYEPHPADWACLKSCGCTINLCDEWTRKDVRHGTWECIRCGQRDVVYLTKIPLSRNAG